jgi:hypothetical protein
MHVVHNLLANVDRGSVVLESLLDGDHRAVNTRTVSARGGEQYALGRTDLDVRDDRIRRPPLGNT